MLPTAWRSAITTWWNLSLYQISLVPDHELHNPRLYMSRMNISKNTVLDTTNTVPVRLALKSNCWVSGSFDTRLLNKWLNNELLLKLDSLNYNTLQALMLLQDTHTNSLDTYVLTLHNSSFLFLHFILFTSLSLISLGALWHSSQVSHTSH